MILKKIFLICLSFVLGTGLFLWGQKSSDSDLQLLETLDALDSLGKKPPDTKAKGKKLQDSDMQLLEMLEGAKKEKSDLEFLETLETQPKQEKQDIFDEYDVEKKKSKEEAQLDTISKAQTVESVVTSPGVFAQEEDMEAWGENALEYVNPYFLYYKIKSLFRSKSSSVDLDGTKKVEAPSPDMAENLDQLEKDIVRQKELDIGFLNDLDKLKVEDPTLPLEQVEGKSPEIEKTSADSLLPTDTTFKSHVGITETQRLQLVESQEKESTVEVEEKIPPSFLKGMFSSDYALFDLDQDSIFNPNNTLDLPYYLNRNLVRFTLDYSIYKDPASLLFVKLYVKDTYVYSNPGAPNHSKNYLQEAYLAVLYKEFSFAAGKINIQAGDGALTYNPTDYLAFPSELFHPRDGNPDRRGARNGLLAAQIAYSLPFGNVLFLYSPDLTNDGDVRENSEINNNRENIYYGKFTWVLFDPTNKYSLIGSVGDFFSPAAPEIFVSYFDRQHLFNVGLSWSIGMGDSMILKLESNYSNKTRIQELIDETPLGPFRQLGLIPKRGSNWHTTIGLTYTPPNFNINIQYFFNYNGMSRHEIDDFLDKVKYLYDNRTIPGIGELYLGRLMETAGVFDSSYYGQHYLIFSTDYSAYLGEKKRPLIPEVFAIVNLQDWSGATGGRLRYEALSYIKLYVGISIIFGGNSTLYGSTPINSVFISAVDINF